MGVGVFVTVVACVHVCVVARVRLRRCVVLWCVVLWRGAACGVVCSVAGRRETCGAVCGSAWRGVARRGAGVAVGGVY